MAKIGSSAITRTLSFPTSMTAASTPVIGGTMTVSSLLPKRESKKVVKISWSIFPILRSATIAPRNFTDFLCDINRLVPYEDRNRLLANSTRFIEYLRDFAARCLDRCLNFPWHGVAFSILDFLRLIPPVDHAKNPTFGSARLLKPSGQSGVTGEVYGCPNR